MAKAYHSLPLDEEECLAGNRGINRGNEKFSWKDHSWKEVIESIPTRLHKYGPSWIWLVHAGLLSLSIAILAMAYCVVQMSHGVATIPKTWSPASTAIKYEIQKFDLPPVPVGPFVGKGDAVDAAWESITGDIGDTMVSKAEMVKMGLDPKGALEITDPATGKRGYRVAIEVFHQLHCLNLLRQANFKSYYRPLGGDVSAESEDLHGHLSHCIDALRQFVMCQGDVNVFPFRFPFNDGDPWPDYETQHVCRNFDGIKKWAVEHAVAQGVDEPDH